jgi:nitrilase
MKLKAAVIQMDSGDDREKNIRRALRLAGKAAGTGAKLIVLPEVFSFRGRAGTKCELRDLFEDIPGPSTSPFLDLARKFRTAVVAGTVHERSSRPDKAYNSSVAIGPSGRVAAVYRKNHLFRANLPGQNIRESDRFIAGTKPASFKTGGLKIGLSVCFDLRFPGLFLDYGRRGCHAVCCPSAFARATGKKHWMVLLRARAIENRCYILAPNQWGADNQGLSHYGHSAIIDPWGQVMAKAPGGRTQIIYAELDTRVIMRYHQILPRPRR